MVEYNNDIELTVILKAMSDATRRRLLTQLCQQGASRVTELAEHYDMSLNAVSKHIKVLEKAELITRTTIGRTHLIAANLVHISLVENWLKELKSIWELRLDKLEEIIGENKMTELTVNINKTINAPIEKVFDAWLNPKLLSLFMTPMPGMPASDVKTDASEGGVFTIIMHAGEDQLAHTGKYLEINRPNKLVFTWQSHHSVDGSIVTLKFDEIASNTTQVTLSHVKFIDEKARSDHQGGWGNILGKLNDVMTT